MAHRRNVIVAFGSAIVGQGVAALVPVIQRVVIDDGIVGRSRPAGPWLAALAATAIFVFGCSYLRRWVGGRVSLDVQYDLRVAIFERLQRLDFAGHDELQTGQLVSRSSSDVGLIQGLLAFLPIIVGNVVLLVVALVVMVVLSPLLTLVMAVMLPLLLVVTLRMRQWIFPATWDAQQRAGVVAGVVDEAVSGVRVVKGFGQEQREIDRLAGAAESLFASRSRLIRLNARYTPALQAIPSFAQVAVLALGGYLAIHGHITIGTFLAFSSYLVQLVAPVRMLASLFAIGQQARAGAERLLDVLDATAAVTDRPGAVDLPAVRGAISFEDVTFGYDRSEPVLSGFDLHIDPGEVVALVGVSGSGKSTVAALVARFYDVGSGRVTIDGVDVRDVTLASLRGQIGVVFEDAFLFSDSVRDNIAYAVPGATEEQIIVAARAAGAHDFISALPDGYNTLVGERGLTLSGGQRQRVALARAILADSRVLVLDDATSSVDSITEESIHDTLRTIAADRTTILIAHRRSTLQLADRVVVVERGRVVEEGTDAELTARSERYRRLLAGPDAGDDIGDDIDDSDSARGEAPVGERTGWPDEPAVVVGLAGVAAAAPKPAIGGPGGGGMNVAFTATPDLLERLERLPAAIDRTGMDVAAAAAPQRGRFRFVGFIRPWRRPLAVGFALVALDSGLTLLGPWFVRRGLDQGVDARDTGALWWASAAFAVTVALDWVVTRSSTLVTGRTAERALASLRVRIFAHLQRMSLDYYDAEMDGRIMTRMTTDVEALAQVIQTGIVSAVVAAVTCLGVAVFLVVLSPPLALAAAVVLPLLALATWWYRRRSSVAYGRARDAIADVNADLQENLSGVRVAQASVREERNLVRYRRVNQRYLEHRLGAQRLIALYFPLVLLLGDLAAVSVLATGSALVHRGAITTAIVIAFLLYLDQFFSPIQQLSQVLDTWQQATASLVKIEELMSTPTGTPESTHTVEIGRLTGAIGFDDVHFRYPTATGDEAVAGVSVRLDAGSTVALVGSTGAGKSTILKLIGRFYDPVSGAVRVDGRSPDGSIAAGVDLRDVALSSFRQQLGIVPQEAFLFATTVRDNIAYGRPDATDAEVEAAARAVGAHAFVASLPHGYREPISERGRSLSSGQRQLLALARARLVDPPILLLDEATSNLDLHSEARVQRAMRSAAAGRTTVLVAHRLQTARLADRILVVEGGRIVQDGTHDDLLATPGRYRDLWSSYDGASS